MRPRLLEAAAFSAPLPWRCGERRRAPTRRRTFSKRARRDRSAVGVAKPHANGARSAAAPKAVGQGHFPQAFHSQARQLCSAARPNVRRRGVAATLHWPHQKIANHEAAGAGRPRTAGCNESTDGEAARYFAPILLGPSGRTQDRTGMSSGRAGRPAPHLAARRCRRHLMRPMNSVAGAAWHGLLHLWHRPLSASRGRLLSAFGRAATARRTFEDASRAQASPWRGASQPATGVPKERRGPFLPT